jgi:hypothetical protein
MDSDFRLATALTGGRIIVRSDSCARPKRSSIAADPSRMGLVDMSFVVAAIMTRKDAPNDGGVRIVAREAKT